MQSEREQISKSYVFPVFHVFAHLFVNEAIEFVGVFTDQVVGLLSENQLQHHSPVDYHTFAYSSERLSASSD